jgi:DNA polymerase elongation subunit (family B)
MDQLTISNHVNDIADEMQNYLNDFYDMFANRLFNIDNHRFEIKKEFVSKSGIWLAKKRYAQWIILNNGTPVDRLDVKGLDVVRSSYPMAFRKFMSDVLIDILKGNTEEELTDKIYNFKNSLSTMPFKDIAKSSSIKDLNKYLPKGKQSAMFRFKLSTPAHVKAAIAYNQLLVHFGVEKKYAVIKNGDKLKWVYLKQNPFGLDAVAFNAYNDPDQIIELVETYIDYDKIFERELLNKLQDFYNVLGWGAVLSSTKTAEKFFSF